MDGAARIRTRRVLSPTGTAIYLFAIRWRDSAIWMRLPSDAPKMAPPRIRGDGLGLRTLLGNSTTVPGERGHGGLRTESPGLAGSIIRIRRLPAPCSPRLLSVSAGGGCSDQDRMRPKVASAARQPMC
jgi:hypothetical protein